MYRQDNAKAKVMWEECIANNWPRISANFFNAAEWVEKYESAMQGRCIIQPAYIAFSDEEDVTLFHLTYK